MLWCVWVSERPSADFAVLEGDMLPVRVTHAFRSEHTAIAVADALMTDIPTVCYAWEAELCLN